MQVTYFQTIGHLRVKIAEAFGFHINEFNMWIKQQYVDSDEDDDKYIRDIGIIQQVVIQKNPNYKPDQHPKLLIS